MHCSLESLFEKPLDMMSTMSTVFERATASLHHDSQGWMLSKSCQSSVLEFLRMKMTGWTKMGL